MANMPASGPAIQQRGGAFYLNAIPGYRAALSRSAAAGFREREDNWLGLGRVVVGFRLRVMTVRDYVGLLRLENAFVLRGEPAFDDLVQFLWLLSPQIERWHNAAGWRKPWLVGCRWPLFNPERWQAFLFARRVRKAFRIGALEAAARAFCAANPGKQFTIPEDHPFSLAAEACFGYVRGIFADKPGAPAEGEGSGLLYLTSWFDAMQSQYHQPDEWVWRMKLPELFARLHAIHLRLDPRARDTDSRRSELQARVQAALDRQSMSINDLLKNGLDPSKN